MVKRNEVVKMPIQQVIHEQRVPVKIWTDDVDERSQVQLANSAGLPFVHHHVAAMPDMHLGIGATIGSVFATHKAIIPAAVGVDSVAANAGLTQAAGDLCPTSARSESLLTLGCRGFAIGQ